MTTKILGGVLPLAKWSICRGLNNPCSDLLGMLEVSVDVLNVDEHVLGNLLWTRRAKGPALPAEHDRPLSDCKLGVTDGAIPSRGP
jgi:hypothetical protein